MRFSSLFLVAALACASPTALAQSAPQTAASAIDVRAVAASVASQIENNFFDATRGREIAQGLRARAASGAYDRLTNPLDLAAALTSYLHPFDGHFAVTYRAAPAGAAEGRQAALPRPPQGGASPAARGNYGFGKIEMLPGGIGYVRVDSFAGFDPRTNPPEPARRAADAAMASVAGARAIILDLRDSRGGAPAMVAYLASHFVAPGADIFNTFHRRDGTDSEAPVIEPTNGRRLDVPLYILVNGGTGSASESLPYTLQAARRATVVGEPTNGRANPGGFRPAGQGFAVFVSGGSPVNPITHRNWEGDGVQPNVVTPSGEALVRAQQLALEQLIAAEPQNEATGEARWALEALRAPFLTLSQSDRAAYAGAYGDARIDEAGGALVLRQGRRVTPLTPIAQDLFAASASPTLRVQFEREGGRIIAVTVLSPNGPMARFARS